MQHVADMNQALVIRNIRKLLVMKRQVDARYDRVETRPHFQATKQRESDAANVASMDRIARNVGHVPGDVGELAQLRKDLGHLPAPRDRQTGQSVERVVLWNRYDLVGVFRLNPDGSAEPESLPEN